LDVAVDYIGDIAGGRGLETPYGRAREIELYWFVGGIGYLVFATSYLVQNHLGYYSGVVDV